MMTQTIRNPLIGVTDVTLASDAPPVQEPSLSVPLLYDYGQIDEQHREAVALSVRRIKSRVQRTNENLVDIGRELSATKDRLPHGQFEDLVACEFLGELGQTRDSIIRTAQNLMNVYTRFGDGIEKTRQFSPSALALLAAPSTPERAIEDATAFATAEGRSPTKEETRRFIRQHRPPVERPAPVEIDGEATVVDDDKSETGFAFANPPVVEHESITPPAMQAKSKPKARTGLDSAWVRKLLDDTEQLAGLWAEAEDWAIQTRRTALADDIAVMRQAMYGNMAKLDGQS